MPRLRLALLLLAARAITTATACSCTCIGADCGLASTDETVELLEPTSPNVVPCRDASDCENAGPLEGPYYEGCWTVAEGFPSGSLPVSFCAEEQPRRRLRFSNYVDDRCFFVEGGDFYTDGITLAAVGDEDARRVFTCAAARLAGVPPSRVVLLEIEQGFPQVNANFVIAVRGEAEALEVQARLKYGEDSRRRLFENLPLVPTLPPAPAGPSEGNERATEAIKACAVTRSAAPLAWRDASVNPFVAPPRVVQEREIPADVRGCCCGSIVAIPLPDPFPVPEEEAEEEEAFEEAFEEPPAPTPAPVVMITSTTMTTAPYSSTTSTSTTAPMVMTTTTTMTTAPYSSTTSTTAPSDG